MRTKHNLIIVQPKLQVGIAYQVIFRNHWCCERCHHKHNSSTNHTLTVYPLDGNYENNEPWNLAALCQPCRRYIQQFNLETLLLVYDSPGIFGNNEPWLKSHIAGIREAVLFGLSPARGEAISSSHHSNLLVQGERDCGTVPLPHFRNE